MAKHSKYNTFLNTGWPEIASVKYAASGGAMISPPGDGKSIRVLGCIVGGTCEFRQDNSGSQTNGTIIFALASDVVDQSASFNFPAVIDFGNNQGVYVTTSSSVTMFYYIHDSTIQ